MYDKTRYTLLYVTLFTILLHSSICFTFPLNCPKLKPSKIYPTHVEKVKPNDIKVVMALGDSLTAGFGMTFKNYGDFIGESRGKAMLIGGEEGYATIPNFLKEIGANTTGQSYGNCLPYLHFLPELFRTYTRDVKVTQLNGAVSQSSLKDLNEEVGYLRNTIKKFKVDIQNDWKLINLFIGANDICSSCETKKKQHSVQFWKDNFYNSIEYIKNSFPKTILSIILLPDISVLNDIGDPEDTCRKARKLMGFCNCVKTDQGRKVMIQRTKEFNNIIIDAVNRINSQNSTSFGAVVQPIFLNSKFSRSHLSNFDCFHLNEYGSQLGAIGVWSNLLSRNKDKQRSMTPLPKSLCPREDTYLFYNEKFTL
ncbi:hypothetical protein CYY_001564 [Polysphondylium violaceum]|uniref:Uncharacterized protein n=1 Tax=Polysphondylium violaceum TaxID=133409 RepID=A0A8J4V7S9_9MYCE|nr:hypothetical protein CYY_001564 [Polysphondylium violaceum]